MTLNAAILPDRDDELNEVVVTGMRVGQGGAQDINFFRGEVAFERIPHPDTLTAEGLMSEHDIVLPSAGKCRQLFCLTGDASRADLLAVPQARYLVGVGFATNIDEKKWRREPVNLIAVVDKSGSMDGEPLDLVKRSLAEVARQLHKGDQMAIVLYGSDAEVHLDTTVADRAGLIRIIDAINGIESGGSTSMEAGLTVGYDLAHATAPAFKGRTRLLLFTDERPNTDATEAESFMGMATENSRSGVGLTTIGVGVQFDAELAVEIGSVRGGNLYFIRNEADVDTLFARQFDYMVSELAHDLAITITPRAGLKIGGVYGVPGELMGWQDASTIRITIPTVFLDNHGGGIFFTLMPESTSTFLPERHDNAALADVSVSYLPLGPAAMPGTDAISVAFTSSPSEGMRIGHTLIDEFTVLHEATSAHYLRNDQEAAYQLVKGFSERLAGNTLPDMDPERKLLGSLLARIAFLSGHGNEALDDDPRPFVQLWGRWKVVDAGDESDFDADDIVEFTADCKLILGKDVEEYESNDKQIYLPDSEAVLSYKIRGNVLSLRNRESKETIRLERVAAN